MARERRDAEGPQEKPLQQSRREATRVGIRAEVVGTHRKTKGSTDWTWQDGGDRTKAREGPGGSRFQPEEMNGFHGKSGSRNAS